MNARRYPSVAPSRAPVTTSVPKANAYIATIS